MNRIFSGIRPSGKLHLGNYLGAIKNWIELQDHTETEQAIFAVVDYHGITTPYDPKTYRKQVLETATEYLAAGINPDKSLLIRQSRVPAHTELAWIFNTITPISWLERLPTYKEKIEQLGGKNNHAGLLTYPVLMAADILIYKSNLVPVGDDQKAHIDITNEIAKKFNHLFGDTFEPVKAHTAEGARIMSLKDPTKKMSKTGDEGIALSDSPDTIKEKIKKAVTDSGDDIIYDPQKKPAISNLLMIHHLLSGDNLDDIVATFQGKTYSAFKDSLCNIIIEFLAPFQKKYQELAQDPKHIDNLLTKAEDNAIVLASETLNSIKQAAGL